MKKKKELREKITIPDNVEVTLESNNVTVKGEKGTVSRAFSHPEIHLKMDGKTMEVSCKSLRRKDKALVNTFVAHIKNMMKGVTIGFEYKMKTVFSHFPIKTSVEGNVVVIQNFLGERSPRRAEILSGVIVEPKGDDITVSGIDKEKVGQTVANIERAAKVKNRDVRVFQDGIYKIAKWRK